MMVLTGRAMRQWLLGALVIPVAVLAAEQAVALEDDELARLLAVEVESAVRYTQPLSEAPAAVAVLPAADLRRYGFRTLAEALASLRGTYFTDEYDYQYLGVRGMARSGDYNSRLLLLHDGVRRNDPLYDSAPIGPDAMIELDWIKRLEFVPGPASALYGGNALYGVANALLYSGGDIDGVRTGLTFGSGHLARAGLLAGRRGEGGREWLLGLAVGQRQGENRYFPAFDQPGLGDGLAHRRDGEHNVKALFKASGGGWQLTAGYADRQTDVPTGFWGTRFDVDGSGVRDTTCYLDLAHVHDFSPTLSQTLRLRTGSYRYQGTYLFDELLNRDEADTRWGGIDWLLGWSGMPAHRWSLGVEVNHHHRLAQRNYNVDPYRVNLDEQRRSRAAGFFIQDEWRLSSRWQAVLGWRYDRISGVGAHSPRLALIHRPQPQTALKLLYGRAFRPANSYEAYYNDSNVLQKANPALQHERIATQEGVIEHVFANGLRFSGSLYRTRLQGLIDQTTAEDGLLQFVNRPPWVLRGVELEGELFLVGDWRLRSSLAWQRLVYDDQSQPINTPPRLFKLMLDGPLAGGWTLAAQLTALDRRLTRAPEVVAPGHAQVNLILSQRGPRGEWRLAIYDLGDRRVLAPASSAQIAPLLPQRGRELRLSWEMTL